MKMSIILFVSLFLTSCFQTENSNSSDSDSYGGEGSPAFIAVRSVFAANCSGCHLYQAATELSLKESGAVIPGDPENSIIYYRLVGSSGPRGPKNMPTGGGMSATDLQTVRTWIENLTP